MENVTVRPVRADDAAEIAAIYRPYVENTAITFEYEAPDAREIGRRIANTVPKYPYIVAEKDGKILGYAYAHVFVKERHTCTRSKRAYTLPRTRTAAE